MNVTQTLGYRMHTDNICVFIMRAFCSVMNIDDIVEITVRKSFACQDFGMRIQQQY